MARKVYGLHARDHLPGGADPLPGGAWAQLNRTTAVSVGSGTSYDTDAFVDWETTTIYGDTYFAAMTDGNGVEGVKILQPGLYGVMAHVAFRDNNASNEVPPTLRVMVASAMDEPSDYATDFGTGAWNPSLTGGWMAFNPAGTPYVVPTISPASGVLYLGGTFILAVTADDLAFSQDSLTCRVASEGGTDDWQWYPANLRVHHLGPVLDA